MFLTPTQPKTRTLTVAVAQPETRPYDVAANAEAHAAAIRAAAARVVVFPELSITGYHMDAPAISPDDARLRPIMEACAETGSLALVGVPVDGEAGPHIALLEIDAEGASVAYRKVWLGGDEMKRFKPGPSLSVIEVDGWVVGLAICRDTGFRDHDAAMSALGIEVYAAAVLDHAHDAHIMDERARRIATEHGVWVAVASFAGSTGEGYDRAAGRSAIWSPAGEVLDRAGPEPDAFARATLSRGNT